MKLTAKIKLCPSPDQAMRLRATLEQANRACNSISACAWDARIFSQFPLHKLTYAQTRAQFPLAAQVVVRCVSKVADAYKLDRRCRRRFRPHGAIAYDDRILNFRLADGTVSIWCVGGCQVVPFVAGPRQLALLAHQRGESDLALIRGRFYLLAVCELDTPPVAEMSACLGVDLGVVDLATDSDGQVYSSAQVNGLRARHRRLRQKLQAKGTRSARRRLSQRSGREARFAADVNHTISKRLVVKAQGTSRGIALEDLGGIHRRVTVRKSQRATWHSWSFDQLRLFVTYKAQRAGVPLVRVDPQNTSRTCPACGHIDKANRKSQSVFSCVACGFSGLADHVAAVNIGRRADVNPPNVACVETQAEHRSELRLSTATSFRL